MHESFYLYNWIETTHVLTLMFSLGLLFLIDLRMLGLALPGIPAGDLARRLHLPMLLGFSIMLITGLLLFYAIPVRTAQSLWFRMKVVLMVAAAINAWCFHHSMTTAGTGWDTARKAPPALQWGAGLSLCFWMLIVVFGRLIAYDWFDCRTGPPEPFATLSGCINEQTHY
ncbi:MAG: hypothetical protein HRT77_09445 [Halioglobus sp.]|nr:hypothetical protein [Halioglobus sp.]